MATPLLNTYHSEPCAHFTGMCGVLDLSHDLFPTDIWGKHHWSMDLSQVLKTLDIDVSEEEEMGEEMEKQPAFFNCTLAFMQSPIKVYIFEGILEGKLTYPPKGNSGFGYDPIFIPNGIKKPLAIRQSSLGGVVE